MNVNNTKGEVVPSHVYHYVVEVNFEKDAREQITLGRTLRKFNVCGMIWHLAIKISSEQSAMYFTVDQKNMLTEFQIVCSILNHAQLGRITLSSDDLQKPLAFFNWNDVKRIHQENGDGTMKLSLDFIDLTKNRNQVDCLMTKKLRMLKIFEDGEFSDFIIKTEKKEFKVHKITLSARSDYFAAMFRSDMKEVKTGVMTIENTRPEVIEELLQFVYADMSPKLSEMYFELFEAAHFYEIRDLERLCIDHMATHMCADNITAILSYCDKYSQSDLKCVALKFIDDHEEMIVKRPDFLIYLMDTVNINNVSKSLIWAHKYELVSLKRHLLEFIVNNYKDMMKNEDYRKMYHEYEWMDIILEVDEFISNECEKKKVEEVVPIERDNRMFFIVSFLLNVLLIIGMIFF